VAGAEFILFGWCGVGRRASVCCGAGRARWWSAVRSYVLGCGPAGGGPRPRGVDRGRT